MGERGPKQECIQASAGVRSPKCKLALDPSEQRGSARPWPGSGKVAIVFTFFRHFETSLSTIASPPRCKQYTGIHARDRSWGFKRAASGFLYHRLALTYSL